MTHTAEDNGSAPARFFLLNEPVDSVFADPYFKSHLQKWDMWNNCKILYFRYDKHFHKGQSKELLSDFFNDQTVQDNFKAVVKRDWEPLTGKLVSLDYENVPATLTTVDILEKLYTADPPIVRTGGSIVKCMEDNIDGFQVSDALRDMLLNDESESAELYSSKEKQEFLFRIFVNFCLGGAMNQFEDTIEPYKDLSIKTYKSLLSVAKQQSTGKIGVTSLVFDVKTAATDSGWRLFSTESRNNFCYVCIDPFKWHLKVWYHAYAPFW